MAKNNKHKSSSKKYLRWTTFCLFIIYVTLCFVGNWFVHHPQEWIDAKRAKWYGPTIPVLMYFGELSAEITDGLGWTGTDCIYDFDEEPPHGKVFFKGAPVRTGSPCPEDIKILNKGEFAIGWSPTLCHPVWVAYHVPKKVLYSIEKRPNFQKDKNAKNAPPAGAYAKTGYDRGHMAPNHAISSRFGKTQQKLTFLTSNICPQKPALNQGPWQNFEMRIADLWSEKYGEIWCIVGAISKKTNSPSRETLSGTNIDIPEYFYQIIIAQEPKNSEGEYPVRALAVLMPSDIHRNAYPTRYIVSIDEIEKLAGINFFPDLQSFIEKPLEAQRPTRLWPVGFKGTWKLFQSRFLKKL